MMKEFEIKIERPKPTPLDEILEVLHRILQYCLCVFTCGCYPGPQTGNGLNGDDYDSMLLDNEKQAVENLLSYLETESSQETILNEEHIRALSILTFSDNEELQRSAALCYTEIANRLHKPLTHRQTAPLVELLSSSDIQVQKISTLAMSNFILNGPEENKDVLVHCGALSPLIQLLYSRNTEVQCNTCGCLTSLATTDSTKQTIATENGINPLLRLLNSNDVRVQRNAAGAILNLTHLQSNRNELVDKGALPILILLLSSSDEEIQYYSSAALSNIAVNDIHRIMMVAIGNHDVIRDLIKLLLSKKEKVKCQACYALRNLASDGDNQIWIVRFGVLEPLHKVIRNSKKETLGAAVGCLRNLSILKANEPAIVEQGFLPDLCNILKSGTNSESQKHAAGILRNLVVGDHLQAVIDNNCLDALTLCLIDMDTKTSVLSEVTAVLAVMADENIIKKKLLVLHEGQVFYRLVSLASLSNSSDVQYNSAGIIGQLCLKFVPDDLKEANKLGIVLYIDKFLKSKDENFVHIGLWTLGQLLKDVVFVKAFHDHHIEHIVERLISESQSAAILELAQNVDEILTEALLSGDVDTTSDEDDV
ncbi:hypothetical protein SNE40_021596 [Patella caerulea]|uniref:Vacuolar protein 8 n=2 Tax=Patella caerulea TaxID=87958 RepID=A0AAN8J0M8_PATCE